MSRAATAFFAGLALTLLAALFVRRNESYSFESEDFEDDSYLMGIQTPHGLVEVEGRFPFLGAVWPPTSEEGDDD